MSATVPPTSDLRSHVSRIVAYFESISPESLSQINSIYNEDAHFKDPFNDVRGLDAIRRIYAHMFTSLKAPRFIVTQQVVDGSHAFLVWDFRFGMARLAQGAEQVIHGSTHLVLSPDGRIQEHIDYWDAAGELYAKLPLLGGFMRWLKRCLAT